MSHCCRPASPSLSSRSRLSSSSLSQGLPFGNITNTPASRAATPAPTDDLRASATIKGIPKTGDASRRRSQGLENLQEQLQDVLQEGSKMQVLAETSTQHNDEQAVLGAVTSIMLLRLLIRALMLNVCPCTQPSNALNFMAVLKQLPDRLTIGNLGWRVDLMVPQSPVASTQRMSSSEP